MAWQHFGNASDVWGMNGLKDRAVRTRAGNRATHSAGENWDAAELAFVAACRSARRRFFLGRLLEDAGDPLSVLLLLLVAVEPAEGAGHRPTV